MGHENPGCVPGKFLTNTVSNLLIPGGGPPQATKTPDCVPVKFLTGSAQILLTGSWLREHLGFLGAAAEEEEGNPVGAQAWPLPEGLEVRALRHPRPVF